MLAKTPHTIITTPYKGSIIRKMTFHAKYIPILEDNNDDQVLPESLVPEEPWRDNSSKGCKLNHKLLRLVLVALLAAFVSGTTGLYLGKYLERHQVEPDWLCKFLIHI